MLATIMTGPITLGKICRIKIRGKLAPIARCASMYSALRSDRTWVRTSRAYDGKVEMTTIPMIVFTLGPNNAITANANMSIGKERTVSKINNIDQSTQRLVKAAIMPRKIPIVREIDTAVTAR